MIVVIFSLVVHPVVPGLIHLPPTIASYDLQIHIADEYF